MALYRCGSGSSGGTDMSSLIGKVLLTSVAVANIDRFYGIIKGLNSISLIFNAGQGTSLSVYGYVGDTGTLLATLSKSANPQTVTVTGYERLPPKV